MLADDEAMQSQKAKKLRSMSNYLKTQIAKKLDQLKQDKQRMRAEGLAMVDQA